MSVNVSADAATTTLRSNRSSASTRSSTSPHSMPSWQCTIRKLLRNLSKTVLTDAQLSSLHISFEEEDESSIRPSTETSSAIDASFATSKYRANIHCLPRDFQTRPRTARFCSEYIASLFTRWAQDLGYQHSENRVEFQAILAQRVSSRLGRDKTWKIDTLYQSSFETGDGTSGS